MQVALLVNKLTSVKTQLPFSYNDMPLCKAEKVKQHATNMGQVLDGAEIHDSPYNVCTLRVVVGDCLLTFSFDISQLEMKKDQTCQVVCKLEYTETQKKRLRKMVDNDYRHHW